MDVARVATGQPVQPVPAAVATRDVPPVRGPPAHEARGVRSGTARLEAAQDRPVGKATDQQGTAPARSPSTDAWSVP